MHINNVDSVIEKNYIDLCKLSVNTLHGQIIDLHYYSYFLSKGSSKIYDWYNSVASIRTPSNIAFSIIKEIQVNIQLQCIPNRILVSSCTKPNNIEELLKENGFSMYYQQTGMHFGTNSISYNNNFKNESLLVRDTQQLTKWLYLVNSVFAKNHNPELFIKLLHHQNIYFCYLSNNDHLVSTAMLYINNDIAGVYFVATDNEFRGKGYATKIMKSLITIACEQRCKSVILQSSDMGKDMYLKLGFKEYSKISHWKYEWT